MPEKAKQNILEITAQIVASHLSNNPVDDSALPLLIQSVYRTLSGIDEPEIAPAAAHPAVSAKKSVFPDFIICLEDGQKLKMLKRHLRISYGLTPEAYRIKWGLPADYPMVAPNYASKRSDLAKESGLRRKPAEMLTEPAETQLPARRASTR